MSYACDESVRGFDLVCYLRDCWRRRHVGNSRYPGYGWHQGSAWRSWRSGRQRRHRASPHRDISVGGGDGYRRAASGDTSLQGVNVIISAGSKAKVVLHVSIARLRIQHESGIPWQSRVCSTTGPSNSFASRLSLSTLNSSSNRAALNWVRVVLKWIGP